MKGFNKLLSIKQLKKGGMIPMLNRKSGFTLVEIMIVVAIIALLAAVAIPNLLGAKKSANQAAAKANTKTLCTELENYAAGDGNGAYPADEDGFKAVSTTATNLCGATTGGYTYACTIAPDAYTIAATAESANTGGYDYTGTTGAQITETAVEAE